MEYGLYSDHIQTLTNSGSNGLHCFTGSKQTYGKTFAPCLGECIPLTFNPELFTELLTETKIPIIGGGFSCLDIIITCFLLFVVVSSLTRKKDKNFSK